VKSIEFCGSSFYALLQFPKAARREAGFQLRQVQMGLDPDDWKPMPSVGPGVREIRIREEQGAFRVMYVTQFAEAVYVLHCFQKKTQKTAGSDVELANRRYREVAKEKLK
jgi:phage-related protein